MPHLITIIKYARYLVKYIVAFRHTIREGRFGFVRRTVQVVPFVRIGG